MNSWILPFFGVIYLIFRIWITEFRLKDALGGRRRFFSRVLGYYLGIALILNFWSIALNLVLIISLPSMVIIFFTFDLAFFINYKKEKAVKAFDSTTGFWLIVERLTLHLQIILVGIWMLVSDVRKFAGPQHGPWVLFVSDALIFIPLLLWDERIGKKVDWPLGLIILILMILISIGTKIVLWSNWYF